MQDFVHPQYFPLSSAEPVPFQAEAEKLSSMSFDPSFFSSAYRRARDWVGATPGALKRTMKEKRRASGKPTTLGSLQAGK